MHLGIEIAGVKFLFTGIVPVFGALFWWVFSLPERRFLDIDVTK